jgi:hypothetical protein
MLIRNARVVVEDRCLVAGSLILPWMDERTPSAADWVGKTSDGQLSVQEDKKPPSA